MRKLILAATLLLAACSSSDTFSDSTGPETLAAKPISSVAPSVSIADVTCSESVGNCLVTITKGRAKSYSKIAVVTTDGTARAGSDYTAVNLALTLGNNLTSTTVSIPILPDALVEGSETFTVSIKPVRNAVIARSPATVTITDATTTPLPTISVVPTSVNENAGSVTVHITRSGDLAGSTGFSWSTQDSTAVHGVNYTTSSGGRTFSAGQSDLTISIPVIDDGVYHSDVAFNVLLGSITGGQLGSNGSVTVRNVEAAPTTQTCQDGTVIPSTSTCPAPDSTPPASGYVTSPTLAGVAPIASEFDYTTSIRASSVPATNPDVVGAFRFICGAGQLLYDDPIKYPGQPGASHLHQFYGNLSVTGNSTFSSMRGSGATTCGDPASNAANRSGYWMPALLDGLGHVVQPDFVQIYYKRFPASSTNCTSGLRARACVALPQGLRFIFGRDMSNLSAPPTGDFHFLCDNSTGNHPTLQEALTVCVPGHHLIAVINAPNCWDGQYLDSPNHRSHVAYTIDSHMGYTKCPDTHPYMIPAFTMSANYSIVAGEDTSHWHFSSDEMAPNEPAGSTYHADWFGAWDPTVMQMWTDNCIDKLLNCSSGLLGNGYALKGADQPRYLIGGVLTPSWSNPNRLVSIPAHP